MQLSRMVLCWAGFSSPTYTPSPLKKIRMIGKIINKRYAVIETIGQGAMGIVYRGQDQLLDRQVAIKILHQSKLEEKDRLRLLREAKTIAQLNHPNIVTIFDAGEVDGSPYIVEELLDGKPLSDVHLESLGDILDISCQLCDALYHAHQHGFIHRDLKPENIMVGPQGDAKLMDFSLVYSKTFRHSTEDGIFGSLFYIPPEQILEQEVDPRADLYSLGAVLYELVTKQVPFIGENTVEVLLKHLYDPVIPPQELNPSTPSQLNNLILQLLSKESKDRPGSALEVREILADLRAQRDTLPGFKAEGLILKTDVDLPVFLNESKDKTFDGELCLGREPEIARLENALHHAIAGEGQVMFVSGEAGSGKSTLTRAFTQRAQMDQAELLVTWGNCNAYSGIGHPYLPFQDVFGMLVGDVEGKWTAGAISGDQARRLWHFSIVALETMVKLGPDLIGSIAMETSLGKKAKTLKTIRGDWSEKLFTMLEVRTTPRQDLQQSHLFEQCVNVLQELSTQQPIIIVLDDLQWADTASISLLFHLGRRITASRLLIIGIYRPDELLLDRDGDRHPLVTVLNEFQRTFGDINIDLDSVSSSERRKFVNACLDQKPNSFGDDFRQTLFEHTGGHALFVIELIRGMQERADLVRNDQGVWEVGPDLNWQQLPAKLEGVIAERIGRLRKPLRDLLYVASVEGEQFTTEVIAAIQGIDRRELLHKLSQELGLRHRLVRECGEQKVGNRTISRFEFVHLIYQRYVYNQLGNAERLLLHQQVTEKLEQIFQGNLEKIAVTLLQHYTKLGDREKTLKYLVLAGKQALRQFAYQEAIDHLSKATTTIPITDDEVSRFTVEGESADYLRLNIYGSLGLAYIGMGDLFQGRKHLSTAIAVFDKPLPETKRGLYFALVIELVTQILHSIRPSLFVRQFDENYRKAILEIVHLYAQLTTIFYLSLERALGIYTAICHLNLAEKAGPSPELAEAYARMSVAAGLIPIHFLAEIYARRAMATAQAVGQASAMATTGMITSVYRGGIGQWSTIQPVLLEALSTFDRLGDFQQWSECMSILAVNALLEGKYIEAEIFYRQLIQSAKARSNALQQGWGLYWDAIISFRRGNTSRAIETSLKAQDIIKHETDLSMGFDFCGILALSYTRDGDLDAAQKSADGALAIAEQSSPNLYSMFIGYSGIAEVYVKLSEGVSHTQPGESSACPMATLLHVCQQLRSFMRIFPIWEPATHLYWGYYYWLKGKRNKALRLWRRSLRKAKEFNMPYETGSAHLVLGRHLPDGHPKGEIHLQNAREIFSGIGAEYDLSLAQEVPS
jgi:serine/threonine protein kinase/tetratricopeptide (TPR) repeat protein